MTTNNNNARTMTLTADVIPQITTEDYVKSGVRILSGDALRADIKDKCKNVNTVCASFLMQELKHGREPEYFVALRDRIYAAAESAGIVVNRKSNTVGVRTSQACTIADSPIRDSILREAKSFNAAYQAAKSAAKASEEAKTAEANEREAEALLATMTADEREAAALAKLQEFAANLAYTFGLDDAALAAIMRRATPKKAKTAKA